MHQTNHEEHQNHSHQDHSSHDHSNHHEMMIEDFKKRFFVSLVITVPILILSPFIRHF